MSRSREVDGFSVVQAFRKAKEHADDGKAAVPSPPPPQHSPPLDPAAARPTRIGKTVMPTRQDITCYLCGYEFSVTGRSANLICPKCRMTLDKSDYTIASDCSEVIRTTGSVRIAAGAMLRGGEIVAREVIVDGQVLGAKIRAFEVAEFGAWAALDVQLLQAKDLRVSAGGTLYLNNASRFRNVEIYGTLTAEVEATGVVTVRAGGNLIGSVRASRLVVEEGGGLNARVDPPHGAPAPTR